MRVILRKTKFLHLEVNVENKQPYFNPFIAFNSQTLQFITVAACLLTINSTELFKKSTLRSYL